jgi:hypothetical protein
MLGTSKRAGMRFLQLTETRISPEAKFVLSFLSRVYE